MLVVYAMYFQLNDETGSRESTRGMIRDLLGEAAFDFLAPLGDGWDAPIFGEPYGPAPVPGPESLDLRAAAAAPAAARGRGARSTAGPADAVGQQQLGGRRRAHRRTAARCWPTTCTCRCRCRNIWYRVVAGLPRSGAAASAGSPASPCPARPAVVVGSNGDVAWGFTNSYGDWVDLVVLEPDPADPEGSYLTADGPLPFGRHLEVVRVKDGADQSLEVLETIWGPVIDTDHRGRRRALRWIAHDPRGGELRAAAARGRATDVDEAIADRQPDRRAAAELRRRRRRRAHRLDRASGPIPRRFGHDGRTPVELGGGRPRLGRLPRPGRVPARRRPARRPDLDRQRPRGRAATMMARIGLGTYAQGGRASQIRDRLLALDRPAEADMLAIQLDDEALFLGRWRELLLEVLTAEATAADPRRAELRRLVEDWSGHAAVDSAGYRMVRAFRLVLAEQLFEAITAACQRGRRALRLLPPAALRRAALAAGDRAAAAPAGAALRRLGRAAAGGGRRHDRPLRRRRRRSRRAHLGRAQHHRASGTRSAGAMPLLARWLDMPATPLPGDAHMPRVQSATAGASERLAVSPGREAEGYFHMPGGQSGHPLSPHYRDGHGAWERGEPTPFLPGPAVHTLILRPAATGPPS